MKKLLKYFNIIVTTLLLSGCEVTNFDLQENPNFLNPSNSNPEFLLNEMQYLFQDIMSDMITNTDDIMRYEAMTGTYNDIADVSVLNVEWERFYEAVNISKTIEKQAVTNDKILFHNAINKLIMGYLTITMVDYVGDIPYTEAGNPTDFPNPKVDSGSDLYKMVIANIDQAIIDMNAATFDVKSDLFYNGDKTKWIAFANTFKLRILIQSKLAGADIGITDIKGAINSLLTKDIIDNASEDFVWKFAAVEEPESRHPYFRRAYINGFSQYMGNQFMWMLKDSKSIRDPRIRYYLYRQSSIDPFSGPPYLACQGDLAVDYCYLGDSYWGLDHGETRTGRGDNLFRTAYGIYPSGGAFDQDQFVSTPSTTNLLGAGILPILTSSFVKFLRAEAAFTIGTNGDPILLLEEGVRASMSKVLNFGNVTSGAAPSSLDVDNYVSIVKGRFNNPTASSDDKLNIIMSEYYLAAYGNSIEAYNAYRRTGFPTTLQIPIDDDTPTFPNSFPYSKTAVDRNSSLNQKSITVKVFWDKKTISIK